MFQSIAATTLFLNCGKKAWVAMFVDDAINQASSCAILELELGKDRTCCIISRLKTHVQFCYFGIGIG